MLGKLCNFYKNKNILITGCTGFLGLGFVEKILRTFPDVGNIYMIVRNKRGKNLVQRKQQYLDNPVFSRLKNKNEIDFSKLVWIEGDLRKADLGLERATITDLQQSVNMIIHSAATVSFAAPLKDAITTNVSATNDLLNIASGCKNFDCFTHISTAYSQARKSIEHIDESILPHPIDPRDLMSIANRHTTAELNAKTNEFILDWPNTYSYTKNAAENLLIEFKNKFPIAIFRPGVVVHSYQEPSPYWIGNNMAFARIMMESQRGLVLDANPWVNGNCVPVDMTINGLLVAAYQTAMDNKLNVFNYTTNNNPFEFSKIFDIYAEAIDNYKTVLIPHRQQLLKANNWPTGSKQEIMVKQIQEYQQFHELALYFLRKQFTYSNDNIDNLWARMNPEEKKLMPFDLRVIDWEKFYRNMYNNAYGTKKIEFEDL